MAWKASELPRNFPGSSSRELRGKFQLGNFRALDRAVTGEFAHPNMIYSMNIHANMRRLSVGAALSEAGSQYSVQHWSKSSESPLRAAVCKPKDFFETSNVAVAFSSSK
jgi:hypothetical protein